MMASQLQSQQQMRYDLDQLRDLTQGVQDGIAQSIGKAQQQEREFMLSRQTLGRPAMNDSFAPLNGAESLNARAGL